MIAKFKKNMNLLRRNEQGVVFIEYMVIACCVGLGIWLAATVYEDQLAKELDDIGKEVDKVGGASTVGGSS